MFSKNALRTFVEKVLTNKELCPQIVSDKNSEDWTIPLCMVKYDMHLGDSRDWLKRERFFALRPENHLLADSPKWYWTSLYYHSDEGLDCCSNYSISFHFIQPKYLYTLYFLSYRLKPYGIKFQYPPPPPKVIFSDVVQALEMERQNASYRGY